MQKSLISILLACITCLAMAQSKTTTHEVAKGETMYSISKRYHVSVEAVQKANKIGADFRLEIGQKLIIPTGAVQIASEPKPEKHTPPPAKAAKPVAKTEPASTETYADGSIHIVVKGETAYHISKENGLTVQQLKDANHLPDDLTLKVGQKLIIPAQNKEAMYKPGPKTPSEPKPASKPAPAASTDQGKDYLSTAPAPVAKKEPAKQEVAPPVTAAQPKAEPAPAKTEKNPPPPADANPSAPAKLSPAQPAKPTPAETGKPAPVTTIKNENTDPDAYAEVFGRYTDSGKKKVVYRGIGMFMQSDNPGNQFLALYNYADMGSILKVTNLMSKESIYVKVIGKVPASDNEKDVILKVSSDAAKKLKVNEEKFLVEVTGYSGQ